MKKRSLLLLIMSLVLTLCMRFGISTSSIISAHAEEQTPIETSMGDVNFDGEVDTVDVVLIKQHIVEIITFTNQQMVFADVNGDQSVDTVDAVIILQYIVGIVDDLGSHQHIYDLEVASTEALKAQATCTNATTYYKSCECGAVSNDANETFIVGTALAHTFTEETVKTEALKDAATCTAPAVYYKSCAVCGAISSNETFIVGTALAHTFTEETVKNEALKDAATCTAPAVYYKSCAVCGTISTDGSYTFTNGDPIAHNFTEEIVKTDALKSAATCTNATTYYKSCECGAVSNDANETFIVGTALAHTFTEETVKNEALKDVATCTTPAIYYKSCAVCGTISTDGSYTFTNGDPIAHNFTEEIVKTDALKSAATCTAPAVYYKSCAVCGTISSNETFTSGSALGHNHQEAERAAATCDEPETITYRCVCGDEYDETIGDALKHDISGVTPEEKHIEGCEYVLVYTCRRGDCGEKIEDEHIFKHEHVASITKEAKCNEDGEKTLTCKCGDSYPETIEKNDAAHNWTKGEVSGNVRTDVCSYCSETKNVTIYTGTTTASTNTNDLKDTEIELNDASINLGSDVIDAIGNKDVTVSAEKVEGTDRNDLGLTEKELEQVGDNPIYNFTINDGTGNISEFGEENFVTITLPYELEDGEDVDSIAVWFINDYGDLESIKATYNNGYVTFKTNHFSYYTVTRLTPAERCALYKHSFTKQVVEGSCTKDSYELYVCVRCHYQEKQNEVVADGHDYQPETNAATCTEDGYTKYTCADCGHSYETKLLATGHNWVEEESVTASCTVNGFVKYGCTKCDEEYSVTEEKLNHDYEETVVPATCERGGYTEHVCKNCQHKYTDSYTESIGHEYDEGTWEWKNPKAIVRLYFTCKYNEEHTIRLQTKATMEVEHGICSNYTKSTFTAKITYNGIEYTSVKVVEEGSINHQFANKWERDETSHWKECVCGEKTEVTKHVFENERITKQATCNEEGEKVAYCTCGEEKVTYIPATGNHTFKNGICTVCGVEYSDTYYLNLMNSWKDINGFAIKIEDFSLEIKREDENIIDSFKLIGSIKQVNVAELALYIEDGKLGGAATGSVVVYNGPIQNANVTYTFNAVIKGDYIYAKLDYDMGVETISQNIKISVDALLDQVFGNGANVNNSVEKALEFITETVVPAIDTLVELNSEDVNKMLENVFNIMFTFEKQADGSYVATLDYAKLTALNENLATKPIAEVVDIYLGEGAFDSVTGWINEMLNLEIADIPAYVDEIGLDSEALIAQINSFALEVGAPKDFDLEVILNNEELEGFTLGMLIFGVQDSSYETTFNDAIESLRELTLYQLIAPNATSEVKDAIDLAIETISECAALSFSTNSIGMLSGINVNADQFNFASGYEQVFISFDLDVVINGRIDVTWSDIIDTIESNIVLPTEDMLGDEIEGNYDSGYYGGYVYYKGDEYYYSDGIMVTIYKNFHDKLSYMIYRPDCDDWTYYMANYERMTYRFMAVNIIVDGKDVSLLIDQYSGAVVEMVQTETGFIAIFEDGTEKEIEFNIPESSEDLFKAFAELYFNVFENPEGWLNTSGEYVDYYYNSDLDEYEEDSQHEFEYEYVLEGETCEDGVTVIETCKHCDYVYTYYRSWHQTQHREISLSELGLCGGYIGEYYCLACDKVTDLYIDDNCYWNIVEENADGYRVSECVRCGAQRLTKTEVSEKDENCRYTKKYIYVYLVDGEEVYRGEEFSYYTSHDYEYEYIFEGETCEDGVEVIRTCKDCGYVSRHYQDAHGRQELFVLGDEHNCDKGHVVRFSSCPCGCNYYADIYSGFNYDEESQTYTCEDCGLVVTSKTEEIEEGCSTIETYTLVVSVSGEELFAYEKSTAFENHNYSKVEINVIDGVTYVIATCDKCGNECGKTNEILQAVLELQDDGRYYYDYYFTPDETATYAITSNESNDTYVELFEEINGVLRKIASDDDSGDGNQFYLSTELVAGNTYVYRIRFYSSNQSGTINFTLNNGETVSALCRHSEYTQTAKLLDGSSTCEDGVMVASVCIDCGKTTLYTRKEHVAEIREVSLSDLGLCGGYIREYYCLACGEVTGFDINDNCYWNYVETNDDGYRVSECARCGAQRLTKTEVSEKDENCRYTEKYIYVYLVDGEEVYRGERVSYYTSHDYEYEYILEGETCEDVVTVIETCKHCDYVYTYYRSWHQTQYRAIPLSELGLCGGYIGEDYCLVCGEVTDSYINDNCDWNYLETNDDGYEVYECAQCGAQRLYKEVISEKDEDCTQHVSKDEIYLVNGNEVLRFEDEYYTTSHNFEYEYVFYGETCEDGVVVITTCKDCDYSYDNQYWGHRLFETERINLSEYGACGGKIVYNACLCGENVRIDFNNGCNSLNWTQNSYYDEENKLINVETEYCKECGLRYSTSYYTERDSATCTMTYYYTVIVNVGENFVCEYKYTRDKVSHDYKYEYVLEGETCEDGVVVITTCKDCDYSYDNHYSYHQMFETEKIDLSEYGSVCGGYAIVNSCACGYDAEVYIDNSLCDLDRVSYSNCWIEGALTGGQPRANGYYYYDNYYYVYTCAVTDPAERACAYKIRYAEYYLAGEGCYAYRYQTWQFGYDEETDTCLYEITFKDGYVTTYHNYTVTEVENGVEYDCPDCGSYYHNYDYYDEEGKEIRHRIGACTLDGVNDYKYYEDLDVYKDGYNIRDYRKYIDSDGYEYWREYLYTRKEFAAPFGEDSYIQINEYSDSNDNEYTEEVAYTYYEGYKFEIYSFRVEGDYWRRYDYTYTFGTEGTPCVREVRYTDSNGEDRTYTESACKSYYSEWTKERTCTQDGLLTYFCRFCNNPYKESPYNPYDHNWVEISSDRHYCSRCGLENANGASGSIVMEDFTKVYGNGENYVVGYWNNNNVLFTKYVSLIFADQTEVILEGVEFTEVDGIRAFAFSKAQVEELAIALGYTDSSAYDVRFAFVPYGEDGSFDYAITFTDEEIGTITDDVDFVDFVGQGETVSYTIIPTEDATWTFTSAIDRDTYATLYDANGNFLTWDDDGGEGNNFKITYQLKAGETYTIQVRWYDSSYYGMMRLIFAHE